MVKKVFHKNNPSKLYAMKIMNKTTPDEIIYI